MGPRMGWRGFLRTALWTACGLGLALYAAVLIVDPYDSLWFSPPFDRAPITSNQRFSYPALARKQRFDSLVIGTSTTRLLRPTKLNETLGGTFANLSLNSGTAYEQSQVLKLFARHHADARTVIFGIDVVWCQIGETDRKFTARPFPPWLYDENPWNDLWHVFNLPTLEQAGRQLGFLLGLRRTKYDRDGYANFLPSKADYDLARVRREIYGNGAPRRRAPVVPPVSPSAAERAAWRFPAHSLMTEMLSALPERTLKVLVFVPYHHFNQPAPGSRKAARWRECKRRLTRIASGFTNTHVLDFMIPSRITLRDENYWDVLHYTVEVADRLGELIATGVREKCRIAGFMDYLRPEPGPGTPGADLTLCPSARGTARQSRRRRDPCRPRSGASSPGRAARRPRACAR